MYIVILLVTVVFSVVAVGGNLPKTDPYPVEKPIEVKVSENVKKADSQNTMQLYTFSGEQVLPTPACPVSGNVDVMFLIDYSGSTRGDKLAREKNAVRVFIDTLARNPQNRVGFAVFNSEARLVSGLTNDFAFVKREVNALPDGNGFTCIKCGLELANSHLASNGRAGLPKVIVLLSDGHANRPEPKGTATQLTRDAVSQGNQQHKIVYYPIGFSGDSPAVRTIKNGSSNIVIRTGGDEGVNEPLMKELAALGKGRYYFAPTNADLENVLRDLGVSLICQQTSQVAPISQPSPQQNDQPVVVQPIVNP